MNSRMSLPQRWVVQNWSKKIIYNQKALILRLKMYMNANDLILNYFTWLCFSFICTNYTISQTKLA